MRYSCGFGPGTRLKVEMLRAFIITLLTNGMSLTDVHILTEEFAFCQKNIILSAINNKLVRIGSIE